MRKAIVVALVAVLAGCGDEKKELPPLRYGAAQPPTLDEQAAAEAAQLSLGASLSFQPAPDPNAGGPGLADEILSNLGAVDASAIAGTPVVQALKGPGAGPSIQAVEVGSWDPACVTTTGSSVSWSGCHVDVTSADPYTGDSMHMVLDLSGTLSWNVATGVRTWNVHETVAMTMTQDAQTITANATADLQGSLTVTATRVFGHGESTVAARVSYGALTMAEATRRTVDVDLGYQANPFCITSGTIVAEQRWTQRPPGATPTTLPDEGWRLEWTGCGQLTVAHGG
jgi:hypothetical protein